MTIEKVKADRLNVMFNIESATGRERVTIKSVKCYGKLWGELLKCFGLALVARDKGQNFYINRQSLIKRLAKTITDSTPPKNIKLNRISDATLSIAYHQILFPGYDPLNWLKASLSIVENYADVSGIPKPGLNMVGKCMHRECANFNKLAVIPMGSCKEKEKNYVDGKAVSIHELCCETFCTCCHYQIKFDDCDSVILKGIKFSIDAKKRDKAHIDSSFQLRRDETLRIDLDKVQFMQLRCAKL